jgi:molecular chaperone GrpE
VSDDQEGQEGAVQPPGFDAADAPGAAVGEEDGPALAKVIDRLGEVERQLAEFHRRSAHREAVIDRLHEENQRMRGGIARAILEPIVADLVRLHDQLDHEARRRGDDGVMFRSFADDVELILDRCGLEVFSAAPGDPFQHDRHRPLAVVPTDDMARDNTVADVVAVGFAERETGRVRRPVQARFYRYSPAPAEAAQLEPDRPHDSEVT